MWMEAVSIHLKSILTFTENIGRKIVQPKRTTWNKAWLRFRIDLWIFIWNDDADVDGDGFVCDAIDVTAVMYHRSIQQDKSVHKIRSISTSLNFLSISFSFIAHFLRNTLEIYFCNFVHSVFFFHFFFCKYI